MISLPRYFIFFYPLRIILITLDVLTYELEVDYDSLNLKWQNNVR